MYLTIRYFLRSCCAFLSDSRSLAPSPAQRRNQLNLPTCILIILAVTSCPLIAFAQYNTPTIPTTNNKQVLLLRNGQTFTGVIVKSTGRQSHYTLMDALGNQLRFPNDQVEFVSDSILEIYAYRRASQIRNNAPACLALAQWCMQSRLFVQAQEQINKAIIISGRTAAIARLEIRLDLLRSPPASQNGQSTNSGAPIKVISADRVQERIDQFPVGVVHQFVRSVQPLLLNHCAVAGCHGPNPKSTFILFRTSAKRVIPHRISQRNLYNTLTTLNLNQPENSLLLTAATTAHGTQNHPSLGIDASQEIANLVNWVRVVASTPIHNIDVTPVKPIVPQNPIMYQRVNSQRSEKMKTPDSDPLPPTLNLPVLPNKLQQWIHSQQLPQTQSALGLGIELPVEMQGPTLGGMKITPTGRVNLTPGVGGNFYLPSNRILRQSR